MLYEANVSNLKGKRDACVESYVFPLSNQHCLGGGGGCIIIGAMEKWQEWGIKTIVWVFQLLLAGIVDYHQAS